jgi:predicted RNase H-like HicB family nuclease
MKYRAGINASDGQAWGQVFDLPGCTATAPSIAELEALFPLAAAEHLAWLGRHGEAIDLNSDIEIDVVERVDVAKSDAQDGEFCYDDDLRPLSDAEIAHGLRLMAYAREDLLAAIEDLPDEILDWRPPKSAMGRIDPWQPEPLTIREVVRQIASSASYYRNCLRDGPIADEPHEIAHDLIAQRAKSIATFTALSAEHRGRMFLPQTPWGAKPEHWTPRKTLRRIIAHERFHTAEIIQRKTWVLLGVPDFTRHTDT